MITKKSVAVTIVDVLTTTDYKPWTSQKVTISGYIFDNVQVKVTKSVVVTKPANVTKK